MTQNLASESVDFSHYCESFWGLEDMSCFDETKSFAPSMLNCVKEQWLVDAQSSGWCQPDTQTDLDYCSDDCYWRAQFKTITKKREPSHV